MWLCHHDGNTFAKDLEKGKKVIVSTGFGLSENHMLGHYPRFLRSIALQKAGIPVQIV